MRVLLSDPSELRFPLERAPRPTTRAVSSKYCQMKPRGVFQRLGGGLLGSPYLGWGAWVTSTPRG